MRLAPGSSGVPTPALRPPRPEEAEAAQAVWEQSHLVDDPGSRPRGGWSLDGWATQQCLLLLGDHIIGIAAIRAEPDESAIAARFALDEEHRQSQLAALLVKSCLDLAREAGGSLLRVFVAAHVQWALDAAREAGFQPVRTINHMLLPAEVEVPPPPDVAGVRIRAMREGEEDAVLEALNRNWEGTWGFVPIRPEMLEMDLQDHRPGMLLAVDAADDSRILATCHAVFDPDDHNPDGYPRAWISNVTVDPAERGRRLGRVVLLAGLQYLRSRGAGSITLGVDAGNPAPVNLYKSVGFRTISSTEAWDKTLTPPA